MKCIECGAQMDMRRENYRYDGCGLPGITLRDVEVSRCPECGEVEVAIPNIEGLHRVIAQSVARKHDRFTASEVRFLRKWLGLSGVDFASLMGVASETVSRWEQGNNPIGGTAERLLRWLVLTREPVSDYPLDMLKNIAKTKPKPIKIWMSVKRGRWEPAIGGPVLAGAC